MKDFKTEEEMKLRAIFSSSPDAITVSDLNGNITECNQAALDTGGFSSKDEVIGKNALEFIAKKDHERARENLKKTLEQGSVGNIEYTFLAKDGREYPAELSASVIKDFLGNPIGFVAITKDITERKRAEEALRRSEEQARRLLEFQNKVIDTADIWIDLLDAEGNVTLWNRAAEIISGYSREEAIGSPKIRERLYPDPKYRAKIFAEDKKIIEKGERIENDETTITCKDGTLKTIRWYSNNILDEKGKPVGLIGVGIDVTEIKKAQEKIRESEEKYRNLFENARDVIFTGDLKGNITNVNKRAEEHGLKKDEIIGKNMLKFVPKEYRTRLLIELAKIARGKSVEGEIEIITPKEKKIAEYRSNPMRRGKKVVGFETILRDVTERKKMQKKLRQYSEHLEELVQKRTEELLESEKRYSVLVEEASDGVAILQDGKIVFANKRGAEIFGYSRDELIGLPFEILVDEKYRQLVKERYERRLRGEKVPATYEIELIAKTGEHVPVELNATLTHYKGRPADLVITRDISERKRLEEERLKLEKLAAIGEAAAMVGHDLRNPLQAIVNTLYLAKEKLKSIPTTDRKIFEKYGFLEQGETLEEQVGYINKIVSDLQDYARPVRPEPVPTSLPQLINDALSSITIPEKVKVSKVTPEDFPKLVVDPALMRRVFTNLIINALQAMPDGGQLTIRSFKTEETASISIQDTGVGIPKEDLPKLFRPLFTTKSKGQGFGLLVCKRLVEALGGRITVESEVGKGSIFTVDIPLGREVS